MWLLFIEPICLSVLRDKNRCLANHENLDMFGWAKFGGLPLWISKFSRFRKGNFPLQFRYCAICKSWFCQYFLLKTKNSLQSSPFTIASPVLSLHHIYIYIYIYPQFSTSTHQFHKDWFSLLCFCFTPCIVVLHRNSR